MEAYLLEEQLWNDRALGFLKSVSQQEEQDD